MRSRSWPPTLVRLVFAASGVGTLGGVEEWCTIVEAAELAGVHPSCVSKWVRRGLLQSRKPERGTRVRSGCLARADVERLVESRREAARVAAEKLALREPPAPRPDPRPDGEHEWLSPRAAAEQLGRTPEAVLARIKRDRLPAVWKDGRWWIRQDQLTLIEAGRLATKTRRI